MSFTVTPITGTTSIPQGMSDTVYLVSTVNTAYTVTLPSAVSDDGDQFYVMRIDPNVGNVISLVAPPGQTINGSSATITLARFKSYHFLAYNSNWYYI
jgi:hypothetical protein